MWRLMRSRKEHNARDMLRQAIYNNREGCRRSSPYEKDCINAFQTFMNRFRYRKISPHNFHFRWQVSRVWVSRQRANTNVRRQQLRGNLAPDISGGADYENPFHAKSPFQDPLLVTKRHGLVIVNFPDRFVEFHLPPACLTRRCNSVSWNSTRNPTISGFSSEDQPDSSNANHIDVASTEKVSPVSKTAWSARGRDLILWPDFNHKVAEAGHSRCGAFCSYYSPAIFDDFFKTYYSVFR